MYEVVLHANQTRLYDRIVVEMSGKARGMRENERAAHTTNTQGTGSVTAVFNSPEPDTPPIPAIYSEPPSNDGLVLPLFMAAIFLSSLLVFSVQPLFAKMVLPLLGGSPGVWNTAMLFFQIVLLAGYGYAHLTTRLLGVKWQACLHVCMVTSVLVFLPIEVAKGWTPPVEEAPVFWLIGLFAVSVGLPFFAVATNAPLLQRWFSHTGHSAAADPYFLYGASNLGSILALLSYPLVFEPLLTSQEQSLAWRWAYLVLVGFITFTALTLWQRYQPKLASETTPPFASNSASTPTFSRRLHWLALAFVPSSLLLGVTMHITTDVAAVPLLWVLPLTLYLLTFVIVFSRRPWLPHTWMVVAQPFLLIPIGIQRFGGILLNILLPMIVFFVTTMVCHGELAKRRPSADHLTEFYLWMSFGGMLGGVFNVLVAPLIFNSVLEYPLMLVLACFLRPVQANTTRVLMAGDVLWPAALLALLGIPIWLGTTSTFWGGAGLVAFCVVLGLGIYSFRHRPIRFGLGIAAILLLTTLLGTQDQVILKRERSFFGVNTVQRTEKGDFNLLVHGRIIHGAQHTDPARWYEPLTYYHQKGPLGQLFTLFQQNETPLQHVGVIGLGVGTASCYQQPGQHWTFHEIDPTVSRLARDTRYFHYLSECGTNAKIIHGDARLSLETVPDYHYDLLIIDAFSSDAIPLHLITREALALYLQKVTQQGVLVFHISNSNLELSSVMGNLAADTELISWIQRYRVDNTSKQSQFKMPSDWVVMTRPAAKLNFLDRDSRWTRVGSNPETRVWTDDYSNILGVLKLGAPTTP